MSGSSMGMSVEASSWTMRSARAIRTPRLLTPSTFTVAPLPPATIKSANMVMDGRTHCQRNSRSPTSPSHARLYEPGSDSRDTPPRLTTTPGTLTSQRVQQPPRPRRKAAHNLERKAHKDRPTSNKRTHKLAQDHTELTQHYALQRYNAADESKPTRNRSSEAATPHRR